jgi:hypothetical protein
MVDKVHDFQTRSPSMPLVQFVPSIPVRMFQIWHVQINGSPMDAQQIEMVIIREMRKLTTATAP